MASQIFSNAKVYVQGLDCSGDMNAVALNNSAELKESTSLIDLTRTRKPGLKDIGFHLEGFWNGGTGNVDDVMFTNVPVANVPVTIAPLTGAEAELCYFLQSDIVDYKFLGKIGEMNPISVGGVAGSGPLVRGTILQNQARTTTGTGTIMNLGALSALQKLYAILHVLSITPSGSPSLACKIQSAATGGFGSPTDRQTFAASVAVGAQYLVPVSGPITDAFWRANWTLTNITSITFLVAMGIL